MITKQTHEQEKAYIISPRAQSWHRNPREKETQSMRCMSYDRRIFQIITHSLSLSLSLSLSAIKNQKKEGREKQRNRNPPYPLAVLNLQEIHEQFVTSHGLKTHPNMFIYLWTFFEKYPVKYSAKHLLSTLLSWPKEPFGRKPSTALSSSLLAISYNISLSKEYQTKRKKED